MPTRLLLSDHNGLEYFLILKVRFLFDKALACCVKSDMAFQWTDTKIRQQILDLDTEYKVELASDPGFISVFVKWYLLGQQRISGVRDRVILQLFHRAVLCFLLQYVNTAGWVHKPENNTKINSLPLAEKKTALHLSLGKSLLHSWMGICGALLPKWERCSLGSRYSTRVIQSCWLCDVAKSFPSFCSVRKTK